MNYCTCTEAYYLPDENQWEPQHWCDYCIQKQAELDEQIDKHYHMIECLEEWIGKPVKRLRVGKPKPRLKYISPLEMKYGSVDECDDLPF